jgi:hypothetical protein
MAIPTANTPTAHGAPTAAPNDTDCAGCGLRAAGTRAQRVAQVAAAAAAEGSR